jgi:hypothetical protein
MRRRLALALALLALAFAPRARAEEETTDPAELLRQGMQAETGDRDLEKALTLYRKVVELGSGSDAARDAALRVASILETQGKATEAFVALRLVTERFATRLDDAQKRAVQEAMVRLIPPGGRIEGPLGEVHKPATGADAPDSPLAAKIDEILSTPGTNAYTNLKLVGSDALPVLERTVVRGSYEKAKLAASIHAAIGGLQSLPVLEKIILSGDPFARGAAVHGLGSLPQTPEVTEALARLVDRLLADPAIAGNHEALIEMLRPRLSPTQLMDRHLAGGPYDLMWLRAALDDGAPGSAARTLELARVRAGRETQNLAIRAVNRFGNSRELSGLPLEGLRALVDRLLSSPESNAQVTGQVLAAMARHPANPDGAHEAWDRVITLAPERRRGVAEVLLRHYGPPPPGFFEDREGAREVLPLLVGSTPFEATPTAEGFWNAMGDLLATTDRGTSRWLVSQALGRAKVPPPASFNQAALAYLEGAGRESDSEQLTGAAARTNDPRYLALVRAQLPKPESGARTALLHGLTEHYRGPGLLELVREALPAANGEDLRRLLGALGPADEGVRVLAEVARQRTTAAAGAAVERLLRLDRVAELRSLAEEESSASTAAHSWFLRELVTASQQYRLREAIPFLLREFRSNGSAHAQGAMQQIRGHYDQVASFEEWLARDGRRDKAELSNLLSDADPEIRRAAVLSLAALGDKEALPRLVRIAKDEKDARVRQAALQAVERLATAPVAPTPEPPPQPSTPPAMGE